MDFQISAENYKISPRTRLLLIKKIGLKLDKLLGSFAREFKTAFVRLQKSKFGNFIVSLDLKLPGRQIVARTEHRSLKSALIELEKRAKKQITKYKDRSAAT